MCARAIGSVVGVTTAGTRFDTVSFLTDYGLADEFVGVVKAVIRDLAPHVGVIDLTHDIAPFDVRAGALALARCIGYVPRGVVLAIVDPGVGHDRRAVAIEVAGGEGVVIGPDNGLLAPAVAMAGGAERAFELTNPEYQLAAPGATFAGRDMFAPAAAHVCNGVDLAELGPEVDPVLLLPGTVPLPRPDGDGLVAEVLWVDRFGNCQLNVGPDDLPSHWGTALQLRFGADDPQGPSVRRASRATSFAELAGGAAGLVLDSYGMLAVCLDQRSAAAELGLAAGDQVTIVSLDDDPVGAARRGGARHARTSRAGPAGVRRRGVASPRAPGDHPHPRTAARGDPDRRHHLPPAALIELPGTMPDVGEGFVNLAHVVDVHDADRVALISRNRETTYGQLREQVDHLRGGLAGLGVSDGDRVAILCANNRYFVITYLAVVGLGAVAVPLNPASPGPEIERELIDVAPAVVVLGPSAVPAWSNVDVGRVPSLRAVVNAESDGATGPGEIALDQLLAADPVPVRDVAPDHLAVMMFTSGTAGPPRAAMLSHGNLLANIEQSVSAPGPHPGRRHRLRRAAAVPHLRAERGARRHAQRRWLRVARAALRPGDRGRVDRAAPGHGGAGRTADVDRVRALRRTAGRRVRVGAARAVGRVAAVAACGGAVRGALRCADRRGVRPHRGVAGGHEFGGHAGAIRVGRSGAGGPARAAGR